MNVLKKLSLILVVCTSITSISSFALSDTDRKDIASVGIGGCFGALVKTEVDFRYGNIHQSGLSSLNNAISCIEKYFTHDETTNKHLKHLRMQRFLALSGIIGATILPILALSPTVRECLTEKQNYDESDALIKVSDSQIKKNTNNYPALLRIV